MSVIQDQSAFCSDGPTGSVNVEKLRPAIQSALKEKWVADRYAIHAPSRVCEYILISF